MGSALCSACCAGAGCGHYARYSGEIVIVAGRGAIACGGGWCAGIFMRCAFARLHVRILVRFVRAIRGMVDMTRGLGLRVSRVVACAASSRIVRIARARDAGVRACVKH
eukprot:scaffold15515_cov104-Isochrysis_galbana.AAC.2